MSILAGYMDEIAVLVLNYTYEPLHFTNAKRAITLLLAGKAESVEASPRVIRSPSRSFHLPAVIRLGAYIRKPFLERVAFNKKNILRRDGYTCQYCSRRGEKLTVDHVVPLCQGGSTTWQNLVGLAAIGVPVERLLADIRLVSFPVQWPLHRKWSYLRVAVIGTSGLTVGFSRARSDS